MIEFLSEEEMREANTTNTFLIIFLTNFEDNAFHFRSPILSNWNLAAIQKKEKEAYVIQTISISQLYN